jgi:integrase
MATNQGKNSMSKNLTSAAVERYRPARQRREIRDGGAQGLFLIVQSSGAKSFALRFRRPDGRPGKLTLGPVDISGKEMPANPVMGAPLTLAGARALASEVHRQRAMGRDVIADHAAAKHRRGVEAEEGAKNTFAAAAKDFVGQYASKKQRRWFETARLLGLDPKKDLEIISGGLAARWAGKPIADLDASDIWTVVEEARKSGAPGLERRADKPTESRARAMLSALSKMFGWLVQRRRANQNPCKDVHRPETPKARDRVLSDTEIGVFWRACDKAGEPVGQLLRMLLLTGCRLNEVAKMSRAELSDDGQTWTIPGERTKNHRVHVVPLPALARDILATVKPIAGGLMFTTNGRSPISVGSKIKGKLDAGMKIPPWRLHDLRRTFVTGMAELGIRGDVIELAVNHVSGLRGGIAGVYNRSELMPERAASLERWASHVQGLVSGKPANVVDLAGKRRRK